MAYIQPNSTIMLLRFVPLEPDYEHTVHSASVGAQATMFTAFAKYTLTANTYQRVNKNSIRVGIVADNLYDCNYVMFQNTNFGSKWFYGFITSVEYINNECTEISYEIDVMQTYEHDYSVGYCFVEREHSVNDTLGENFVPESLNYGDHVYHNGLHKSGVMNKINIYILAVNDQNPYHNMGSIVDGVYTGGNLYAWTIENSQTSRNAALADIQTFLNAYEQKPEEVIAIWCGPTLGSDFSTNHVVANGALAGSEFLADTLTGTEGFGSSWRPNNKKLYMYPYNFYALTDGNNTVEYHYEYFKSALGNFRPKFQVDANMMPTPEAICRPLNYKGCGDVNDIGILNESLSVSGWGVGSWTNDTWSQLVRARVRDYMISTVSGGTSALFGQADLGISKVTNGITGVIAAMAKDDMTPRLTYGNSHSGGALSAHYALDFYGGRCRITEEFAKIIDNYFDVYGYQTNRIKIPNRDSRPHWNYVKTQNCELIALTTMPADDASKIKSVYNKGITFWKNIQEVGMYNLDNKPTP